MSVYGSTTVGRTQLGILTPVTQNYSAKPYSKVRSPSNEGAPRIALLEDRPNFQSLSEIINAEEIRRGNGSTSAMSSFQTGTAARKQYYLNYGGSGGNGTYNKGAALPNIQKTSFKT